ncbi:MAG: redoxin domain-containing protein [Akkermansiaceae bacterium]|nr:redoxin domain-containing protein [Akkermansiaceae bacterium]
MTMIALVVISGGPVVFGQAGQAVAPPSPTAATTTAATTVKEQIKAASKAFDKQNMEFMKMLRAEKDNTKKRELYKTGRPDPSGTVNLILKLARENPKADGVENGLVWTLRVANPTQRREVTQFMLTHYQDSKSIGNLAQYYGRMYGGGEPELREIVEKAGNEAVRLGATYYLAEKLMNNKATQQEGLTLMKQLARTPGLDKKNPNLLAQANIKIMVLEKLGIGCIAPDIVGTDHEGKEFKLSDYRGQVVLLDFWGIW